MPAHTYQRLPPRVFSAQSATQQHPDQSQDKQQEGLRTGEDRSESHRAQSLDPRDGLGHWTLATHESDYLETMGEEQELDACADDDDEYNLGPQTEAERTSRKHQLNRSHTEMQDKIDTLNLKWRHERHTVDHVDPRHKSGVDGNSGVDSSGRAARARRGQHVAVVPQHVSPLSLPALSLHTPVKPAVLFFREVPTLPPSALSTRPSERPAI